MRDLQRNRSLRELVILLLWCHFNRVKIGVSVGQVDELVFGSMLVFCFLEEGDMVPSQRPMG